MDPGRLWDESGRPLDGRTCPGSVRPLAGLDALGPRHDNRVNCNRIPRAAVYDIPPALPGDSAGQEIALIERGLSLHSAKERRSYKVTTSLTGWAQT